VVIERAPVPDSLNDIWGCWRPCVDRAQISLLLILVAFLAFITSHPTSAIARKPKWRVDAHSFPKISPF